MDFFQQSNYRINKLLLRMVGLWPYQKKYESCFVRTITSCWLGSIVFAQMRKIIVDHGDPETIVESVAPFIVDAVSTAKVLNSILNSKRMCQLLNLIQNDVNKIMGPEKKVMMRCIDDGRKFVLAYTVMMYSSMIFYLILPLTPKIIVAFGFSNISTSAQFPFPVDFYIDPEENYVYLQIYVWIGVFFNISMLISVDAMFVMLIQHACGIFSALSYRLEHLAEDEDLNFELYPNRLADETFWIVVDCIKKHKEAIQFSELLNATYCWLFMFIVGLNMAALSFSGFQVTVNLSSGDTDEVIRQALFTMAQLMHLFFESYFSQRLTDYSLRVYEALNGIKWYKTSMRTRKLLNLMVLASTRPCELKAGRIYTMSMENFSVVVRTSMSYFTVISSMQ